MSTVSLNYFASPRSFIIEDMTIYFAQNFTIFRWCAYNISGSTFIWQGQRASSAEIEPFAVLWIKWNILLVVRAKLHCISIHLWWLQWCGCSRMDSGLDRKFTQLLLQSKEAIQTGSGANPCWCLLLLGGFWKWIIWISVVLISQEGRLFTKSVIEGVENIEAGLGGALNRDVSGELVKDWLRMGSTFDLESKGGVEAGAPNLNQLSNDQFCWWWSNSKIEGTHVALPSMSACL